MKIFILLLLGVFLFSSGAADAFGQYKYKDLTIILLRHAEKDKQDEEFGNSIDPRLSEAGNLRAQKLADVLEKYKPDAVFSSQFNRTLSTAAPYSRRKRMQVQFYNHRKLDEIAQIALAGNFKTIVIVGHNSTTPALTNLLIGADKYKPLGENEYDKIFIVKIGKNKNKPNEIEENVITY
jgi:2,3-bisphosphoglycerate-dependent phosphoglycerate mutase